MKKLMLGNEAVARGFYEAGCRVVSSYPGTPSTEITEYAATYDDIYCEWAPNEKVGMEVAFGASLAGARSACCMKHVGLNVAADPLFTLSYTGVNGGLVVFVADDPGMHSSQNEQDSRHYAIAAKLPMLEPADSVEAKEFTKAAFELSEKFDTPVIVRMCTRIAHSQCAVELCEPLAKVKRDYVKDPKKYIMAPANAIAKHPVVEARCAAIAEYAESSELNKVEIFDNSELGIITSGTSYQYVKEVFGDSVSVLKLGLVNPLPTKLITDFAKKHKRVVVIEELDPVIESFCKTLGLSVEGKNLFPICGEFSQSMVAKAFGIETGAFTASDDVIPVRPPVMCAGCPHRATFYVLKKLGLVVSGDIGCYTLGAVAPLASVDTTICMGASVSAALGMAKARGSEFNKKLVSVIGDSTFIHSGITGLIDIVYNKGANTVIILDNSITGMTGHQENPTTGYTIRGEETRAVDLLALCRAVGIDNVTVADPFDLDNFEKIVKTETEREEPSVIIAQRPCALLKRVKYTGHCEIDSEKCKKCKKCMKLGCPAISVIDGAVKIDLTQCNGCGLCVNVCPFDAIEKKED